MKPNVSILICTHNRAPYLTRTLESLGAIKIPKNLRAELIVVDNASTDATLAVVQRCGIRNMEVRTVSEPQPGKARACNTGITASRGEILIFTDDDVLVPRDWLAEMCQPILDGRAEAVSGAVIIPPNLTRPWMSDFHRGWMGSTEGFDEQDIDNMVGGNMACHRNVFERVPALDSDLGPGMLGYHEEALFTWQLKLAGFRIRFLPHVIVEHHFPETRLTRDSMLDSAMRAGRSSGYIAHHWEHRSIRRPLMRWGRALIRLLYWRLRRFGFYAPKDRSPRWEMEMVMDVSYFRQYMNERKRRRFYKALGLIKHVL